MAKETGAGSEPAGEFDFAIAGGGIGGTVAAELLARAGKRVVALERNLRAPQWTRPEILWPVTADFLCGFALGESFEREVAAPIEAFDIHDGRSARPLVPEEAIRRAGVRPWSVDPNRLRELLLERASFELRRGVEVLGVLREDGAASRVAGLCARELSTGTEIEVRARTTIADDGVASRVREGCRIPIDLRTFSVEFLCFGLDWPAGLPPSRVRLWANRGRTRSGILGVGAVPLPHRRGTGLVLIRPWALQDPRAPDDWNRFLDADPLLRETIGDRSFPAGFAHVRRPFGHARSYGVDGAVLIGDAAHPVSPAGGQGSSAAVADARTLAELALAGSRDLAGDLERRRRGPNDRSLAITRATHRVWTLPRWCRPTSGLFAVLAFLRARPSLLARALRNVSTRFLEEPPRSP
jgi:2-polyprenyl-6-methoxyphenol hydroxylase-like FAD-dependent oxidoreductase